MSTLTTEPVTELATGGDDPAHVTCCNDDNLLLCGQDGTDQPWVPISAQTTCLSCEAAEIAGACPLGGWCE